MEIRPKIRGKESKNEEIQKDFSKHISFFKIKKTSRSKRKHTDWKEIFANYVPTGDFISQIKTDSRMNFPNEHNLNLQEQLLQATIHLENLKIECLFTQ